MSRPSPALHSGAQTSQAYSWRLPHHAPRGICVKAYVPSPKGWGVSAYAAFQTAADSNARSANELPDGLWQATAAKYTVNINQVKLIAVVDLDGDGKSDAVLKILGDYCGLCGCSVGIFKKESDSYRQISDISCVEEIVVDKKRTNGWLDLLASSKKGYFRLTFDGQSYPVSPQEGKPEKKGTSKEQ